MKGKYYCVDTKLHMDKDKLKYFVNDHNHSLTGFICLCRTRKDANLICKMLNKKIGFYQKGKKGINTKFLLPFEWVFNLIPIVYERFFCFIILATQLRFELRVIKSPT